jgi:hypothetical protein
MTTDPDPLALLRGRAPFHSYGWQGDEGGVEMTKEEEIVRASCLAGTGWRAVRLDPDGTRVADWVRYRTAKEAKDSSRWRWWLERDKWDPLICYIVDPAGNPVYRYMHESTDARCMRWAQCKKETP